MNGTVMSVRRAVVNMDEVASAAWYSGYEKCRSRKTAPFPGFIWTSARSAAIASSLSTPAVIGIAQNVRPMLATSGWLHVMSPQPHIKPIWLVMISTLPKPTGAAIPRRSSMLLNGQDRNRETRKKLTTSTLKSIDAGLASA